MFQLYTSELIAILSRKNNSQCLPHQKNEKALHAYPQLALSIYSITCPWILINFILS